MDRTRTAVVGGVLAGLGALLGALSLGTAWAWSTASTRVAIVGLADSRTRLVYLFDLGGGGWVLTLLLLLVAAGAAAAVAPAPVARAAGGVGAVLGLAGLAVICAVWPGTAPTTPDLDLFGFARSHSEAGVGAGAPLALIAMLLLGTGTALLGLTRAPAVRPGEKR
ncbi:hypothetical protein Cs7R123_18150 [Catellatospora sp. TT07R-123]|uniref:hypothetical protein n=1 Tax=Catellatospora sp. TT07R-123 TaxID=2733863 RepID=UPI001B188C56|nr:hypothetical protein [Catellatospora sp. TT07R-123]GHJ44473.1 hypothetical protein Cs7R123_18150 [Catellatospora sp. TT07R-123]